MNNIYEALSNVMRDCEAVGKDSTNPNQHYKYRGIDAVMNAVNPALTKNHVFVIPEVIEITREERAASRGGMLIYSIAKVRYTFCAEDGSSVTAVVIGEGMDSGDKSMNKAMSAAFKYALFQVLCIPTEEMIDSETDSPEPTAKQKPEATQIAPKETRIAPEENADAPIGAKAGTELSILLRKKDVNIEALCKQKNVNSLSELTNAQYRSIVWQLNKKDQENAASEPA